MSEADNNLVNQYLIATPIIKEPLFASSLVYMCEHNENGSMGLVVNQLAGQNLDKVFEQIGIECDNPETNDTPVFIGGPVNLDQGFVLHSSSKNWGNSLEIAESVYLTSSRDILQSIADNDGPQRYLVLLGFSGWSAGQLEQELQQNAWLTCDSEDSILFHQDWQIKWQLAVDKLGIDINNLSPTSGHA